MIRRSIAWLFGYRRLTIRYERHAHLFCAFLSFAAVLNCYTKLAKAKCDTLRVVYRFLCSPISISQIMGRVSC